MKSARNHYALRLGAVGVLASVAALFVVAPASALNNRSSAFSIASASIVASSKASSLRVTGSGTSGGMTVVLSLAVSVNAGSARFTYGTQSVNVIRIGQTMYIQGPGTQSSPWVIAKRGASDYNTFLPLLSPMKLMSSLYGGVLGASLSKLKPSHVRGLPVYVVTGKIQGEKDTLFIASHGPPYLLRSSGGGGGAVGHGTIDFFGYNQPVNVNAPSVG